MPATKLNPLEVAVERTDRNSESADAPFQVTLRFGTFLLACVLWAFQFRHDLPQMVANLCQLFGLCGLAFYFCLELAANQQAQQEVQPVVNFGDHRLSLRLHAETKMARIIKNERLRS